MIQLAGKYVVIGLGKTGLSCVRFLRHLGCDVAVLDTRAEPPGIAELKAEFPDVPFQSGELDKFDLTQAQELIVSPGLSTRTPAIARAQSAGVSVAGDIELLCRTISEPIIAVTGSNGKSTVVTLLGKLLEAAGMKVKVAGNIGMPVLDALLAKDGVDVWVLELSSFQLETTFSLSAQVACILNVSEDHLDRYDSINDYASAKQRIYTNCETAVYWIDDPRTCPLGQSCRLLPFGGNDDKRGRFHVRQNGDGAWVMDGDKPVVNEAELRIKGSHNLLNVAAVFSILSAFNVDYAVALDALREFPGLPHRCQWVAESRGVTWFNDSKGTNVGAAEAAITGLGKRNQSLIWLAGGEGKGADFTQLKSVMAGPVKLAILFGRDAQHIADSIAGACDIVLVESLEAAVQLADERAVKGDSVLLSPACASFDMFKNYEDRGNQFIAAVNARLASA